MARRFVHTTEEAQALPNGTVIMAVEGSEISSVFQRDKFGWYAIGDEMPLDEIDDGFPYEILWMVGDE